MDWNKKLNIFLVLIVLLAGGLRLYRIDKAPPALNWDEAALGYNAYSLLKTGKDEYGQVLPINFRSFDDYKPPVYIYLIVPFILGFGLNEISVRLPSVIAGTTVVLLGYVFVYKITKKRPVALAAAALLAIEPWSVFFSRAAFEANFALMLFIVALIMIGFSRVNKWNLVGGVAMAGINTLVYHSAKIYFLLLLIVAVWRGKKIIGLKKLIILMVLGTMPLIVSSFWGGGLARLSTTSIGKLYKDSNPYVFAGEIVNRYFAYFSPAGLFVRGSNEPNQHVLGYGIFYVWEFGLLVVGGYWLIRNRSCKVVRNYLKWTLLLPLPATITWSWFSPIRVLPLFFILSCCGGIGLAIIVEKVKGVARLGLLTIMGLAGIILVGQMWITQIITMPYLEYGNWQWGFKETIQAIAPYKNKYHQVIWETSQAQPHIFSLFYSRFPPTVYHQFLNESGGVPIPRINFDIPGITFRKIFWPKDRDLKNVLFIGSVYSLPEGDIKRDGATILKEIIDPSGFIAYRIVGY